MNRAREAQSLPIDSLSVKTYFFRYPSVDDLLDLLGSSLEVRLIGFEGASRIGDILRKGGLENMDNFTQLSPRSLHVYEGIPIEAVRLLYAGADEMIRATHLGRVEDIEFINEITAL